MITYRELSDLKERIELSVILYKQFLKQPWDDVKSEEIKISEFIRNIPNGRCREYVYFLKPLTLYQCLAFAKEWLAYNNNNNNSISIIQEENLLPFPIEQSFPIEVSELLEDLIDLDIDERLILKMKFLCNRLQKTRIFWDRGNPYLCNLEPLPLAIRMKSHHFLSDGPHIDWAFFRIRWMRPYHWFTGHTENLWDHCRRGFRK